MEAWLVPPEVGAEDTAATIQVRAGCLNSTCNPQRVVVETSQAGTDGVLPQGTPIVLSVYNPAPAVGGTWLLGTTEGPDGRLTYAVPTTMALAAGPTDTWLVPLQTPATSQLFRLGVTSSPETLSTHRVLTALPTADPNRFELAWQPADSTLGVPLTATFLYDGTCAPCGRDSVLPGSIWSGPVLCASS